MKRLTDEELERLLNDTESDLAERKQSFRGDTPKKSRQAVCAFANEQEERILNEKRRYKNIPFDIYPVPSAKISDLARSVFEIEFLPAAFAADVLESNVRTYESTNAPVRVYWFNDRIEINSPGGPYGNATPENFGMPGITDYRNPNIGDILKTFGFIQAFGRGIAIARQEMERNGNPPLAFEVSQSAVVCTLRAKQ